MIRTLIIDDCELIYYGLKAIISEEEDIEIIGFAKNGSEGIKKSLSLQPDTILMDVQMPEINGIKATEKILAEMPEAKIIILSGSNNDSTVTDAVLAGAKGYLSKDMLNDEISTAIRSVHRGSSYFAPGILESLASSLQTPVSIAASTPVVRKTDPKPKSKTKSKPEPSLFAHADWYCLTAIVFMLPLINGIGHWLGHAGLFLLMIALAARPIKVWWNGALKERRSIGIFAFAASVSHAIYATCKVLHWDWPALLKLSWGYKIGMLVGVISLLTMLPAAITSFSYFQKKLGKQWRQIHLLTVPGLALAVWHTVAVGPHYLSSVELEMINHLRIYGILALTGVIYLLRQQIFWVFYKKFTKA
jgi:DNA-binding NarL/FixJ family response regulator/DMSO/TMAO reductase YedYZ heme-binding membrane subunit